MAREVKFGVRVTGDSSGAVTAMHLTEEQLGKLRRELDKTNKETKDINKSFREWSGRMSSLKGALAGVAAGVGVLAAGTVALIDRQAQAVKETNALAQAVGVSTGTLQEWQYAGESVGIAADKMGDIFKDVSDKLGDFMATGGGEAADLFNNLGLSVEKLRQMRPDEQLLAIAEAIGQVDDRSQQVFYLESLADDASRLLPLLENDAQLLKENARLARDMNIAMSDVENERMLEAAASLKKIKAALNGVSNTLAIEMAPVLEDVAEEFNEFIQSASDSGELENFFENSADAAKKFLDHLENIASIMFAIQGASAGARGGAALGSIIPGVGTVVGGVAGGVVGGTAGFFATDIAGAMVGGGTERPGSVLIGEGMIDRSAAAPSGGSASSGPALSPVTVDYKIKSDLYLRDLAILYEEQAKVREQAMDFEGDFKDLSDSAHDTFDEMSIYSRRAAENMQDAFADFLFDPFDDGLKGMLEGFANILRQMAAEAAAAQIFEALDSRGSGDGTVGSILSGLGSLVTGFGGGTLSTINTSTLPTNTGALTFGGARAGGGPVDAGKFYVVGERGPELLAAGGSGHVIPNHAIGTNVEINVHNNAGAEVDVQQRRGPGGTTMIDVMVQSSLQRMAGDGRLDRTLSGFGAQRVPRY